MLGMHNGSNIPAGCCKVVFIPHAHEVLIHVPKGRIIVPRQRLTLLPVAVSVLDGPVLQVSSVSLEDKWAHQIEAALSFSGVALASSVEGFSLA